MLIDLNTIQREKDNRQLAGSNGRFKWQQSYQTCQQTLLLWHYHPLLTSVPHCTIAKTTGPDAPAAAAVIDDGHYAIEAHVAFLHSKRR